VNSCTLHSKLATTRGSAVDPGAVDHLKPHVARFAAEVATARTAMSSSRSSRVAVLALIVLGCLLGVSAVDRKDARVFDYFMFVRYV
jgi:hypothetical protein